MWTVVFSKKFYNDLTELLFSTAPRENGCFLLANSYKTKDRSVLLVTETVRPTADSWNYSSHRSLEPSSSYVSRCVATADTTGSSPVFVHTHPNLLHPATFSAIDRKSNQKMFENLSSIIPDRPIGSLVFSRHGICGVVFDKDGMIHDVSKVKIVGHTLTEFPGVGFEERRTHKMDARYDRQIRTIGEQSQKKLQDMVVTIVGAGGTGSSVAVQLARMGIKNLLLIDKDSIDVTNLSRIYGSSDTDVGKPKVNALKKHIRMFSKSKVVAVYGDVADKRMLEMLIGSDIIFACTDNHTSRFILNDISNRYYIPLIDVGCRIHLNDDHSISQAVAKVQIVTPDSACLWCSGTLDGKQILHESLSKEEKTKLANEGYYDGLEKQPSVISLTTMAACMAVTKFLSVFGVFGNQYNPLTQIELKNGFMIDYKREISENCICRKNLGIGPNKS